MKGYVRVEPLPAISIKGKPEPVAAFRIVGLGTRRSRIEPQEDRPLSPFVGRELAVLREALAEVEAGRGQVVGIVGEPGAGKSRLLYEFRQALGDRPVTYLEGRCLSFGGTIPYLPLQDVLRNACGLTDADSPAEIAEKVRVALAQVGMKPDEGAPYLLQLLAVKEGTGGLAQIGPETIKARIFQTLRQMTLNGSRRRPLVIAIEDLHWIDKTSEEYLATLAESLGGSTVLLLTTTRPGYTAPWSAKSYATQVALRPLPSEASLSIVEATVERANIATPVAETILAKAEGNPFFLEELTRAVLEHALGDTLRLLPDSIQGVLAARIDRLDEGAKQVLQIAAVLGREFSTRLLRAVAEKGPSDLEEALERLRRLEFLYEQPSGEEPGWLFKHALTQEVAYESLLTTRRQILHEAIGRALEALYSDRFEQHYELLVHHYTKSANGEKAFEYLELANQKAAKANAVVEAQGYFSKSMRLLDSLPDTEINRRRRVELLVRQVTVFLLLNQFEQYYNLKSYESLAVGLGDQGLLGRFYARLAHCEWYFGHWDQSIVTASKAAALCEAVGYHADAAYAYGAIQWNYFSKCEYDAALVFKERALQSLEREFHPRLYVWSLTWAAIALAMLGRWDDALREAREALRAAEAVRDDSLVSFAAWTAAWACADHGDSVQALQYADLAVEKAPTPADRFWAEGTRAYCWCQAGDPLRATPILEQWESVVRSLRFVPGYGGHGDGLARAYLSAEGRRCAQSGPPTSRGWGAIREAYSRRHRPLLPWRNRAPDGSER